MKLVRCSNGHFYDEDKFGSCPHCGNSGSSTPKRAEAATSTHEESISYKNDPISKKEEPGKSLWGSWRKNKKESDKNEDSVQNATSEDRSEMTELISMDDGVSISSAVSITPEPHHAIEPERPVVVMPQSVAMSASSTQFQNESQPVSIQQPSSSAPSLRSAVAAVQEDKDDIKTVGFFGSAGGDEPVVGWLVAIEGPAKGISYELIAGKNSIGRSSTMTVVIVQDNKVSRDKHTTVMYEPGGRKFYLLAGESNGMVYYNGDILLENKVLAKGDRIKVGDSVLLFVPLCGEDFSWEE